MSQPNIVTNFNNEFLPIMRSTGINFKLRHKVRGTFIKIGGANGTYFNTYLDRIGDKFYISYNSTVCDQYTLTSNILSSLYNLVEAPGDTTLYASIIGGSGRAGCASITMTPQGVVNVKINGKDLKMNGDRITLVPFNQEDEFELFFEDERTFNSDNLIKVSPFFSNPQAMRIPQDSYYDFCSRFPTFGPCYDVCNATNPDARCFRANESKCFGVMNPQNNTFCQTFAIQNQRQLHTRIRPYCDTLDKLNGNKVCLDVFRNKPTTNCQGDPVCENARNLFEDLCRNNTTDEKCKCINPVQLAERRRVAIEAALGRATDNAIEEVNVAIAATNDPREKQLLEDRKGLVRDHVRRYFEQVAILLAPTNSQCLIPTCNNRTDMVVNGCNLQNFTLNVCINNIDIVALKRGTVTFRGSQNCIIGVGRCDAQHKCPEGFECRNGWCVGVRMEPGPGPTPPPVRSRFWLWFILGFAILIILFVLFFWLFSRK